MKFNVERWVVVIMLTLALGIAYALSPMGAVNPSGAIIPLTCDANGNLNTAAGGVKYDRVESTVNAKIDSVATDAATIISTVASITPPCSVVISCPAGELWIAEGIATTTAASVMYHIIEEKQSRVYNISTSTYDFSVMSADTAVSSCSISVHSLVQ